MGSLVQSLALDAATGNAAGLDVRKFAYVGRLTSNIDLGIGRPGGPVM